MKKIILASNSPRRKEILKTANIDFTVKSSNCEELFSEFYDETIVKTNSFKKALDTMMSTEEDCLVIGADTIVILDNVCLVKPQNIYEAIFMLKKLSNKTHMVVTSHTIMDSKNQKEITKVSKSFVTFRKLGFFEILFYVLNKKPLDKAGSYGIQDFISKDEVQNIKKSSFISKLEGSYYNVMGLDIDLVLEMLSNF